MGKRTGDIVRSGFAGYARSVTGRAIEPWSLSRVIHHPDKAPYERQALLYDYVCEYLAPSIAEKRFHGVCSKATAEQIDMLLDDGKARVVHPWDIEGFASFCSPVTKPYIKEYFGYRMSANAGRVVRFYLDIKESDDPTKVTYRNLYRSGATTLEIIGTGRLVHDTLYLVGEYDADRVEDGHDLGFDLARLTDEVNRLRTRMPSGRGKSRERWPKTWLPLSKPSEKISKVSVLKDDGSRRHALPPPVALDLVPRVDFPVEIAQIRQTVHRQAVFVRFALDDHLHQMPGQPFTGAFGLGTICERAVDAQRAVDGWIIHRIVSGKLMSLGNE